MNMNRDVSKMTSEVKMNGGEVRSAVYRVYTTLNTLVYSSADDVTTELSQ